MFISGLLCVWEDARGPIDPNPALNIYLFPPPPESPTPGNTGLFTY